MLRKVVILLLTLATVFSLGIASVCLASADEEASATLVYIGDDVQITEGDETTNGVTDGTIFTRAQGVLKYEDITKHNLFPNPTEDMVALGLLPSYSDTAAVFIFEEVTAADYDYVKINIAVTNWNNSPYTVYFYTSDAKVLNEENSVASFKVAPQSPGTKLFTVPAADLADSTGKIKNITIKKVIEDKDLEKNACQTFLESITFGKYSVLEEKQLSNATSEHLLFKAGSDYLEAVPEENRSVWAINYHLSQLVGSGFKTGVEGSLDGNVFALAWDAVQGLCYPGTILGFPSQGEINAADELVVRIKVSASIDAGAELWFTPVTVPNIWDAVKRVALDPVAKDTWIEVSLRAKDFISDGKFVDMGVIVHLTNDVDKVSTPASIMFDDFSFREVVREVAPATSYTKDDISKVIPIGEEGFEITGEWTGDETFDFTKFANVGFIRKDCESSVVRFQMSINDFGEEFDMYYVLRGGSKYYSDGGIYYWFSNREVSLGAGSIKPVRTPYPADIEAEEFFDVEIGAIAYRVDGIVSGYYAYLKINDELMVEDYFDNADIPFGKHFGMYMHTSGRNTTIAVKPIELATENELKLELKVPDGKTELAVNDFVRLVKDVECNMWGQYESEITILSGTAAEIDEEGYLIALKDGVVTVGFTVEYEKTSQVLLFKQNDFEPFTSNVITFTIGEGEKESTGNTGSKGSCGGAMGGVSSVLGLAVMGVAVLLKKKNR